ncbi:MAG: hypothetical protein ACM3O4_02785 [Ignavibacteriales bacterium]
MSMPEIPENKHRPNLKCTVIDLLESIALEEISLSHLLNAEAEKIQAFVGKGLDFPLCSNYKGVVAFSKLSVDFLEKIIMKQWLLTTKLNKVIEIGYSCFNDDNCHDTEPGKCGDCTRPLKKFCEKKYD